jgi:hypothetical protein
LKTCQLHKPVNLQHFPQIRILGHTTVYTTSRHMLQYKTFMWYLNLRCVITINTDHIYNTHFNIIVSSSPSLSQ